MTIPVFVTYRDRYTMLQQCVRSLITAGFDDITVIDNGSERPLHKPDRRVRVITADNEHRHLAPWALGLVPADDWYVVCDCDIEVALPPPDGWRSIPRQLQATMEDHPEIVKLGLGIATDFPEPWQDHYVYSMAMELSVAHRFRDIAPGIIDAPVDTHFALHRPGTVEWPGICGARTTWPYLCRHQPWYNVEYSEEERLYYQRAGEDWARTHSAETLVTMPIVVPFTELHAGTVISLHDQQVQYAPMSSDDSYFLLLADKWEQGEGFIVVEHKISVEPDTIRELTACPGDWCGAPYNYRGYTDAVGLGCTKFSTALIKRHPWLMRAVAQHSDERHPATHWCRLDAWIYDELTLEAGEKRCENHAPVHKLGNGESAHGCV